MHRTSEIRDRRAVAGRGNGNAVLGDANSRRRPVVFNDPAPDRYLNRSNGVA